MISPGMWRLRVLCTSTGLAIFLAAASVCAEEAKMTLQIHSPAFTDGGEIPAKYTCEGDDVSPPLAWEGIPGMPKAWY